MARLTQQDFQRLLEFRVALREFQRWSEDQAEAVALTHVQHQLLVAIKGHPGDQPPAVGDLAGYLLLQPHSTAELINRAEAAGLVERVPDPSDGRVVRVQLTKAGDRMVQRLAKAHLSRLHELAAVLDELITRHESETVSDSESHALAAPESAARRVPLPSGTIALRLSSQSAWCSALPPASVLPRADPTRSPGQICIPRGRWAHVPGIRHPLMINGVPVVTAPAEIEVTTADQLRAVLLHAAARGHATIVVDMTRARFCDSAGLTVLVRAHKREVGEGGELRLVIAAGSAVARIFALTRLDLIIPLFGSLDEALAPRPAAVIRPLRPRPSAGRRPSRQPGLPGRRV